MTFSAFKNIGQRVKFLSYDVVADLHVKTVELSLIQKDFKYKCGIKN